MKNINNKVKEIIANNLYATISVSKDNIPWIANIYYAYDKEYNFYWYSSAETTHSRYIKENPFIAISIFNSTLTGDDVDAVYIKAEAYELENKIDILCGLKSYGEKMLRTGFTDNKDTMLRFIKQYKDFQGLSKLRMYKAKPKEIYKLTPSETYNDKFIDSKITININDLI